MNTLQDLWKDLGILGTWRRKAVSCMITNQKEDVTPLFLKWCEGLKFRDISYSKCLESCDHAEKEQLDTMTTILIHLVLRC